MRTRRDVPPPLALNDNILLMPKLHWRYLGFFFDKTLSFKEHVCFYSTKVFSTVHAMRMLGNSNQGLSSSQKRLLYRLCVVLVATYGYQLWFFKGTKCKTLMLLMNQMQQRAALWITGTFRTSPTTAIEAISGLMPIHLHLSKLTQCSSVHTLTLHRTHAVHAFTGLYPERRRHPLLPMSITPRQANQAMGPLIEAAMCQPMPNKPLVLLPDEGAPGQ
jgi:hypothetical protein